MPADRIPSPLLPIEAYIVIADGEVLIVRSAETRVSAEMAIPAAIVASADDAGTPQASPALTISFPTCTRFDV